ncbi:MAG: DsbC family protein [Thermodesulfobacteriota bacterium]
MQRKIALGCFIIAISPALAAAPASAFKDHGAMKGSCVGCHSLSREEAASVLKGMVDNVVAVIPGPFPGVWEVDAGIGGKVYPLYMDYSKKLLFQGNFFRVSDRENLTRLRYADLNRVDVSSIPLENAIVLGNPSSKRRLIVLTDPSCPHCVRLHGEIKTAIAKDPEVAFFVMPYPRNPGDRAVYAKCLAAVCDKSGKVLDDIYSGKEVPPAKCDSRAVDETIRLADRLQIQGTPSMILPDGRVVSGYREADELLSLTR